MEHGLDLQYIKEQNPELCLAAVRQNGRALYYVKEQNPELCMAVVRQDVSALEYVKDETTKTKIATYLPQRAQHNKSIYAFC